MNKNFISSACKFFSLVFVFAFINFTSSAQEISTEPAAIKAGEGLFNANCKACHAVSRKLVGPALGGVENRAPSIQWIKDFVHNSSAVIKSGDDYAVKLYNEYNKTQMTAFTSLKDEDIMNILAYVKSENEKVEAPPPPPPGQQPGQGGDTASSKYLNIILIGMVIILLLLLVILGLI
ncbi:MAG TPA: cytochrome c, partial [Chryseolinea sp.]|nr:cytochrome c [Chryseolinea sp.]